MWAHFPSVVAVCMSDLELFGFVLSVFNRENVLGKKISIPEVEVFIFEADVRIFEAEFSITEAEISIFEAEVSIIEAEIRIFEAEDCIP